MTEEARLIQKWRPLLDFSDKTLCAVADKDRSKYADFLEQVEDRYMGKAPDELLKLLIPLVRRHGDLAYFEEGIYTPPQNQKNHGESFRAIKMMNPDQNVSKFIAIALDPKYNAINRLHVVSGTILDYEYTFDF